MRFDDLVDFGNLVGDFVGGGFVFGDHDGHFPFVAFEKIGETVGEDFERDVSADNRGGIQNRFDAVDVLELFRHGTRIFGAHVGIS